MIEFILGLIIGTMVGYFVGRAAIVRGVNEDKYIN